MRNGVCDLNEFCQCLRQELDGFNSNTNYNKMERKSMFEWFYEFGFWTDALEVRHLFSDYFEEYK